MNRDGWCICCKRMPCSIKKMKPVDRCLARQTPTWIRRRTSGFRIIYLHAGASKYDPPEKVCAKSSNATHCYVIAPLQSPCLEHGSLRASLTFAEFAARGPCDVHKGPKITNFSVHILLYSISRHDNVAFPQTSDCKMRNWPVGVIQPPHP